MTNCISTDLTNCLGPSDLRNKNHLVTLSMIMINDFCCICMCYETLSPEIK